MFCDSHLHLGALPKDICVSDMPDFLCTCASSLSEFRTQNDASFALQKSGKIVVESFGLHPFFLESATISECEELARTKKISAIGEIGLDFFSAEYREKKKEQEEIFCSSLLLSQKYSLPVIVHCRKALSTIFALTPLLKKCPCVIFHGFEGSSREASALLKRGVNAYFGVGKTLLRGDKSARDLVAFADKTRLLFETDSPYQRLYRQEFSLPSDVRFVYEKAREIANVDFQQIAIQNFIRAFLPQGAQIDFPDPKML